VKRGGITIKKRRVSALLRDVDEGQFAIPHLQSEFVWKRGSLQCFSITSSAVSLPAQLNSITNDFALYSEIDVTIQVKG